VAQSQTWEGVYDPEFFDKEKINNRLRRLAMHLKIA